jgi:predicted PurR-regulated permease PerM
MIPAKYPFFIKAPLIILGLYLFMQGLYLTQTIVVPLVFSGIIAILMNPIVKKLTKWRIPRVLAIIISIFTLFVVAGGIIFLVSMQLGKFSNSLPLILDKGQATMSSFSDWITTTFDLKTNTINSFIDETRIEIKDRSKAYLGESLNFIGHGLVVILLVPVYIFMILYYKPLLLDFVRKLFGKNNVNEVDEVLLSIKTIVQQYLLALLIEVLIGIEYALLFGVLGALLNLIPYIGGIVAISFPMLLALATHSASSALLVLLVYGIIQLIDNNYIMPKLVGSRVKINALVSIVAVIAGGALWGVFGMFLSIPITAIIKVIFDHFDSLKPWGFLLGDTMPPLTPFKLSRQKK